MQCPFCNKSVTKKDAYCRHCGKAIPLEAKDSPPHIPRHPSHIDNERDKGAVLARAYRHIFGDEYMNTMVRLFELNHDRAIGIMQEDLGVWFGSRPKKTSEEIQRELDEFFSDPVTQQNMGEAPAEEAANK